MKSLTEQLSAYYQFHTQKINKIAHFVGVPCIVFALMIFLGWIHLAVPNIFSINFNWILLIALLIYYFKLDVLLAAGLGVILILMAILAEFISQPAVTLGGFIIFLVLFIIGTIALFVGHYYEKQKPAFLKDWRQVLIGPMFLFAELMFALGYRLDLKEEVNKSINQY